MIVSERFLRDYISTKAPIEEIAERLTMAGLEVKNIQKHKELKDAIFEIEITSNRPDWLSYLGIAREVAALYNEPVQDVSYLHGRERVKNKDFSITIKDKKLCPYYAGVIITGIVPKQSPKHVQDVLCAIGLRPVNLVVDLTNIVMFEMGQPMHAFDLPKLSGGEIIVRRAKEKELFTAINHTEYTLRGDDLVIADRERAVALAGIMGGVESEVSDDTTNILLESAYFDPATIRSTARYHNLTSDSSYRFERKVDMATVQKAQERFIYLLHEYGGLSNESTISEVIYDGSNVADPVVISFEFGLIEKILGFLVPEKQVVQILEKLGLTVSCDGGRKNTFKVTVPTHRPDLMRPVDLVEEIARIYGYDKVPETLPPRIAPQDELHDLQRLLIQKIVSVFTACGCYEVVPFTLIDERKISHVFSDTSRFVHIINPQNKDLALLRPSLIPSFMEIIAANIRYGNRDLRFFEIGATYSKTKDVLPDEKKYAGCVISGATDRVWNMPRREYDLFEIKGILERVFGLFDLPCVLEKEVYPQYEANMSFAIIVGGKKIGAVGKISRALRESFDVDQDIYAAEFSLQDMMQYHKESVTFVEPSKYPVVKRDIALIVEHDVLARDMQQEIFAVAGDLVRSIQVFDSFSGKHVKKGKKNLAFSMEFSSPQRTLSGEEVQAKFDEIYTALNRKFGATFREI